MKNIIKFAMIFSVLLMPLTVSTMAMAGPDGVTVASEAPGDFVQHVGDQALAVIADQSLNKQKKQDSLTKIFAGIVDFPWVGRFVMGRYWREATDDQKKRYLTEYKKFLLLHYTSRFTNFSGGTFTLQGVKDDGDGEFTVSMRMKSDAPDSEPVQVDYRVHAGDIKDGKGHFQIFDVIVEGVGLLNTQRSEFSSVIAEHGVDYLIDQLVAKSSAGAV